MNNVAPLPASAHSRLRRIVVGLLALVFIFAIAGMIYENIFEARDQRFNPMTGSRFDVGGFKMHIDCTGEGSPTVILDSGLGDTYLSWLKVQPQVAKFTRVCSYDRAGLGYSDSSSQPRTSKVIATELHALLQAAGIAPPPYVLVGHSIGGFNVRLYASLYRSDVAGMLLVDSSHPAQFDRLPPGIKDMQADWTRKAEFTEYTMPFGIPRLLGQCDENPVFRAAACNWHTAAEAVAELKSFSESAAQAAATGSLGDIPFMVISHDPNKRLGSFPAGIAIPANQAWEKMQEELAQLSTRGTQVIAPGSSHDIQLDRPDVVIGGIRSVVQQVRPQVPAAVSKSN